MTITSSQTGGFTAAAFLLLRRSRFVQFAIWFLAKSFEFDGPGLSQAISATFARRETPIPTEAPDALTAAFAVDSVKQRQWTEFAANIMTKPASLAELVKTLAAFLMPHAEAARKLVEGNK